MKKQAIVDIWMKVLNFKTTKYVKYQLLVGLTFRTLICVWNLCFQVVHPVKRRRRVGVIDELLNDALFLLMIILLRQILDLPNKLWNVYNLPFSEIRNDFINCLLNVFVGEFSLLPVNRRLLPFSILEQIIS